MGRFSTGRLGGTSKYPEHVLQQTQQLLAFA